MDLFKLVTESYNKKIISTRRDIDSVDNYIKYLGYYLNYAHKKNDEDIIKAILSKIRVWLYGAMNTFYEGYMLGVEEDTKIDELTYFIKIIKSILTDSIFITDPSVVSILIYHIDTHTLKKIFDRMNFNIKPINMIDLVMHYIEIDSNYRHLLTFLVQYYIDKGEITFNDVIMNITNLTDITHDSLQIVKQWLNRVILNQI